MSPEGYQCFLFLWRLRCIFAEVILRLEDTSLKEVCLTAHSPIYPLLVYEYIVSLCFKVIWVGVGPLFSLIFLEVSV